jgi:hypothetical protein
MSLASRISTLASRIGLEVKTKIDASHPGVAKAWVCFGYAGGQVVIRASYNVASVTRLATGRYRVTFASAMPDADYCWVASTLKNTTILGLQRIALVRASADAKTAQHLDVSCASSTAATDADEFNVTVFH